MSRSKKAVGDIISFSCDICPAGLAWAGLMAVVASVPLGKDVLVLDVFIL